MPVDHYENFPVASFALPKPLRRPVTTIYRFARSADDIADEGEAPAAERVHALDAYRRELDLIALDKSPQTALFVELAAVIRAHSLPLEPFHDLLDAFEQDVTTHRYETFDALLDYCRRSANPVGVLMLHLFEAADVRNVEQSDHICSALQLINFWQDIARDWDKGRIYIPLEDLHRFAVTEAEIAEARPGPRWAHLMAFQIDRAEAMLRAGAPLAGRLEGRIGLELRLIVQGGQRIVDKLRRVRGDVFRHRPVLGGADWLVMLWRAATMRSAGSRRSDQASRA